MARGSRLEECMICGEAPCICNAKPAKPPKAKKSPAPAQSEPVTAALPAPVAKRTGGGARAAMKAAAMDAPQRPTMARTAPPAPIRAAPEISFGTDEELIWRNAVRVLNNAGLLDEEAKLEQSMILNGEPSPREQLATWKAIRRAEQMELEKQGGAATSIRS